MRFFDGNKKADGIPRLKGIHRLYIMVPQNDQFLNALPAELKPEPQERIGLQWTLSEKRGEELRRFRRGREFVDVEIVKRNSKMLILC